MKRGGHYEKSRVLQPACPADAVGGRRVRVKKTGTVKAERVINLLQNIRRQGFMGLAEQFTQIVGQPVVLFPPRWDCL